MATSRTKLTPARLGHRKTKWAAVSCAHALPAEVFQTYFEGLIIVYYTSLSSLVLSSSIILRASWIMLLSMVRDFADWIKVCWNSKNKWQKWEFNVQTSFSWCELSQARHTYKPDIRKKWETGLVHVPYRSQPSIFLNFIWSAREMDATVKAVRGR